MQSIISQLDDQAVWEGFLAHRLMKGRFTWPMFSDADDYVAEEGYLPVARAFKRGEGPGIPERKRINKMGTGKKRTVYCFSPEETRVLKLVAFLLYKYDDRFAPNCYSFRRGVKASDAIFRLRKAHPFLAKRLPVLDIGCIRSRMRSVSITERILLQTQALISMLLRTERFWKPERTMDTETT